MLMMSTRPMTFLEMYTMSMMLDICSPEIGFGSVSGLRSRSIRRTSISSVNTNSMREKILYGIRSMLTIGPV